jgi:hypothetical protein
LWLEEEAVEVMLLVEQGQVDIEILLIMKHLVVELQQKLHQL